MNAESYSGAELEKALKEGTIAEAQSFLTGMVKPSEKTGHVSFSQSGCEAWVDLPTGMIEKAETVGQRPCRDHSHPVMRITLKTPKDAEGKILAALLTQTAAHPKSDMPCGGSLQGPPSFGQSMQAAPSLMPQAALAPQPAFGFGGFEVAPGGLGPTLPRCGWELCVCGSSLPGYPPILCPCYCCTWPNGSKACI